MAATPIDALTRHQVFLQRYAGRNVQAILPMIRRMAKDLERRIAAGLSDGDDVGRLIRINQELRELIGDVSAGMQRELFPELEKLAAYEAEFMMQVFEGAATVEFAKPAESVLAALVKPNSVMKLVQGQEVVTVTMADMFRQFADGAANDVRQTIQAGVVEGRTSREIARDVQAMVTNRTRRQADALVRTVTNHVGNQARSEFYKANDDLIAEEEFVATLDNRTTITCAANDGKTFPVGQGPIPPLHYNCRSVRVAKLKPQFRIPGDSDRASMLGPVSGQTTYAGWLRNQGAQFQDEVLGVERAKLFRSGEVTLDRFTDDSGRVYTLEELRAREGLALN